MHDLFEYAPEPLVLVSSDRLVKKFNMKAKELFGEAINESCEIASFPMYNPKKENIFSSKSFDQYFDAAFDNREVTYAKSDNFTMTFLLSHRMTFFGGQECHYISFKNISDVVSFKKIFEELYDSLSVKTIELDNTISEKVQAYKLLKEKDDEMLRQLTLAHEVQASIFPDINISVKGYTFSSAMKPASIVTGDILATYDKDGKYMDFVIADVTGHGVPAALITMMLKMSFRTRVAEYDTPDAILTAINRDIHAVLAGATIFMTLMYVRLHYDTGIMELFDCGHPPPLILHQDRTIEVPDVNGMMLGVLETLDCGHCQYTMQDGDTVIFYTDGVIEAHTADEYYNFYEDRFYDKLKTLTDDEMNNIPRVIFNDIYDFVDSQDLPDDVTMFCITKK